MSEEKKYGVELVKKAIKFVYDVAIEGIEDFKDKKLSLAEVIGFSDNAYSGIMLGMKSGELWNEIKDIDTDEGLELADYVGSLVQGSTNDEIDLIINNAIEAIKKEVDIYNRNVKPIIELIKIKKAE